MFKPLDAMPTVLRRHVRYPEDYFNTQAEVYATYHVQDPSVLYNKGDQWQIPSNVSLSGPGRMSAYYVIMRLPGATKEQFLLMLPFVPNGRSNMISWLGAQSDGADYGKAVNFVFSSSTTVFGPSQVESTINSDPRVSSQLTLWNQRGSRAIMGNLLVVPIQDTLLYVQPLYLVAEQIQLPQLKEVIVFYRSPSVQGTQGNVRQVVAMQPTLSLALAEVFGVALPTGPSGGQGGATPSKPAQGGGTTVSARAAALIAQANREFNAALAAQRSGDWAGYGRQLAALKKTLGQLAKLP
jgi:uncharacterized membrane protein (UPF0182 family)